eukprot:gb/GECG01009414.1/.p1 GENE.gb/GECG01009414.1/~~gb/GECG01009414.1/.p1  ORF type:complete len:225 (+),score=23.94 gb/GECG01009414.1/:1-675(+)
MAEEESNGEKTSTWQEQVDARELAARRREQYISERNERKRRAFRARADYMMSLSPGEYLMGRGLAAGAAVWETTPIILAGGAFADMIYSYRQGKRFTSLIESARYSSPYVARMWFRLTGFMVLQQALEMWIMKQTRLGERYDPDPWDNMHYTNVARAVSGAGAGALVAFKGKHGFTAAKQAIPRNKKVMAWAIMGAAAGPLVTDICTFSLRSISYAWSSLSSSD